MSKLQANTQQTVEKLLKVLSSRNRDVISRRFGLKNGRKETLESIGRSYKITRERVRQIEEATLAQLKAGVKNLESQIQPYFNLASSILEEHGGVLKEDSFFEQFSGNERTDAVNAAFVLLLKLDPRFNRFGESDEFFSFWTLGNAYFEKAKQTLAALEKALENHGRAVEEKNLLNFFKPNADFATPKVLMSYVSLSKNIGKNIFGEIGLSHWPEINPRGVRDKAYLVLNKCGKPSHFTEISKLISQAGFGSNKANIQTVHNELIKDKRFVLVGRGMYGLSNWGYKSGTVKDVLVDIMKDSGKPLSKKDLVARVLSARFVKENTVFLNLQDSKVFKKNENGTYTLKEA